MNQKNIILTLVLIVALGAITYFFVSKNSSTTITSPTTTNPPPQQPIVPTGNNPVTQTSPTGLEPKISQPLDSGNAEIIVISIIDEYVATIKVDRIIDYTRDSRATYEPLKEGAVMNNARFGFSTQPATVKHFPIPTGTPSTSTQPISGESTSPAVEAPIQGIPGYGVPKGNVPHVYSVSSGRYSEEYETILPGVKEGDRIRAQFSFSGELFIGEYKLLK